MQPKTRILFLTLDGFSNVGGIQSVCKNMAFTLNSLHIGSEITKFSNLSLYDDISNDAYIRPNSFYGYKGNKYSFVTNALKKGIFCDIIIISHINLLLIALIIKLLNRKSRIVMLAHGTEIWRTIPAWKTGFMKLAVSIWAVSTHTKSILVTKHKIKPESIVVLNNCLDPFHKIAKSMIKPEELLTRHGLSCSQPILISVCRISRYDRDKGYDLILKALPEILNEFPNIHYFMIGRIEPSESKRISYLIDKLAIKNCVTILGHVPDLDLAKYYLLADIFVLPSTKEGFGMVFIEAASFGCIVISGNQDGSNEALMKGALGISVDPTSACLALQIAKSLRINRNPRSRRRIERKCVKHFSQSKYEIKIQELLK